MQTKAPQFSLLKEQLQTNLFSASLQIDIVDCWAGALSFPQQNTCSLPVLFNPSVLNQFVVCLINFPQCLESTSWTWKFHPENSKSYYFTPRKGRKTSLSTPRKEKGLHYPSFLVFFCTNKTQLSTFLSIFIHLLHASFSQIRMDKRRQPIEALLRCFEQLFERRFFFKKYPSSLSRLMKHIVLHK